MDVICTLLTIVAMVILGAIGFEIIVANLSTNSQRSPQEEIARLGKETREKISAVCDEHVREVREKLETYHRQEHREV